MLYYRFFWLIYMKNCQISGFIFYGSNTRGSVGSLIFFLDKPTETYKKISADENPSCPSQNIQNQKSSKICYILDFWSIYMKCCQISGFTCYGSNTRGSVGSLIFFLDKPIETCKKLSADENPSCPSRNIQNQKSSKYAIFVEFLADLYEILPIFRVYVWWFKHKVLCGISDIFPRQTIRVLLKFFCRWESKMSFAKYTKS